MRWTKGCKPGIQYKISKKQFHLLHPPVLLVVESSQLGHFQVWQQSCFKCGTMHWFPRMEFYISPVSVCKYFWISVKKYFSFHRQDFCPVSRKTRYPKWTMIERGWDFVDSQAIWSLKHIPCDLFGQLLQHLCLHLPHNKVTATIELQQHHCNNCNVTNTLQKLNCINCTATIELQQGSILGLKIDPKNCWTPTSREKLIVWQAQVCPQKNYGMRDFVCIKSEQKKIRTSGDVGTARQFDLVAWVVLNSNFGE